MYNSFIESTKYEDDDIALINESLSGDRSALEKLLLRHQAWIYNITLKMVMDPDDACDITQEILSADYCDFNYIIDDSVDK